MIEAPWWILYHHQSPDAYRYNLTIGMEVRKKKDLWIVKWMEHRFGILDIGSFIDWAMEWHVDDGFEFRHEVIEAWLNGHQGGLEHYERMTNEPEADRSGRGQLSIERVATAAKMFGSRRHKEDWRL